jgi:hypothetical protein
MDEIVARFRWTVDELIAARRWHYRQTMRPFFRGAIWVFALLFFVAGIGILVSGELGDGAIVSGLGGLIALSLTIGTPWLARFQFRHRPDQNVEVEWRIKTDNIQIIAPHSRTEADWSAFHKVVKTPAGFLFYLNPQLFHWIPRDAFGDGADFVQIPQFAEKRGIQVVDMEDRSFRRQFRFQTKNMLWAMFPMCIGAGAFSFLILQQRFSLLSFSMVWAYICGDPWSS